MSRKVIIVGGGASGLLAAIQASKQGAKVTILDHMNRVGKKILVTGNGRCNLTSELIHEDFYFGANKSFIKTVLNNFSLSDTKEFFENLGLLLIEKNQGIYPYSQQASTVLNILRYKCQELGVEEVCDKQVNHIKKNKNKFIVEDLSCDAVVLATGGCTASKTGSDGSGFKIAKELGHNIIDLKAGLVALNCEEDFYKSIQGVRAFGSVSLYIDDKFVAKDKGEIQFTSTGISGIPVFQISHFASKHFNKTKNIRAEIDFFPDMSSEELMEFLSKSVSTNLRTPVEHLSCILNKKIAELIYRLVKPTEFMTVKDLLSIVKIGKSFPTRIISSKGFEHAQVTVGGVDSKTINPYTMESLLVENLFFSGEIIDVNGLCGGYNLQWAWSTGYIAGTNAGKVGL